MGAAVMAGPWEAFQGSGDAGVASAPPPGPWMNFAPPDSAPRTAGLPLAAKDEMAPRRLYGEKPPEAPTAPLIAPMDAIPTPGGDEAPPDYPARLWQASLRPGQPPVSAGAVAAPVRPDTGMLGATKAGVVQSLRDLAAAPAAVRGEVQQQSAPAPYAEPLAWSDFAHPSIAAPKIAYSLAKSLPTMAGGILGGIAGGALTSETGPLAAAGVLGGGALGAGGVSAIQSLAPYFAAEMAKPGVDPDQAFNAAMKQAGQQGAFSAAGWALFGLAPFQSAAKNLLFQAFGAQPALAVAQRGVENVEEGKPVTEGMGEAVPGAVAGTLIPMAGHAAVRAAGRMLPGRGAAAAPEATPEPPPGTPPLEPTAERAATETPQTSALDAIEALKATPVEQGDQAARDDLAGAVGAEPGAATPEVAPAPAASPPPEAAPPAEPPPAESPPTASAYTMFDPRDLNVDPERLQYKASDDRGVTGALHGIDKWEPALANPITVWQDTDGKHYVVNGHQRTDLALRAQAAGQQNVQIPARVFRAADGYTPEFMRALGAYQNIAEGSGTPIDAAKVMRATQAFPADMTLPDLPPKQAMVIQGRALAKLSPEAFGVVENGVVPAAYAAAVGDRIADPHEQLAALNVLARAQPANAEQARIMVEDIRNSGFLQGSQTTLFGDEAFAQSLVGERAKVLDNAMRVLRRAKGVFRAAVEGEETLTGAGNSLDREGNIRGKTENERLLDTLQRDATTRGPLSDALTVAARDLASGKPISVIASRFLGAARKIVAGGSGEGVQPGAPDRGAGLEGEAGRVEDANQAGIFGEGFGLPKPPQIGAPLFDVQPAPKAQPARGPTQETLFGRGDAAVQAQAARDQAGRGALLAKVPQRGVGDLGLFDTGARAQRELPTGTARPESRRPAGNGGTKFGDFIKKSGIADPYAAANAYVVEMGRADGKEHLTAYDAAGHAIVSVESSGLAHAVSFPDEMMAAIRDPSRTIVGQHNHPRSSSLSDTDLMTIAFPGMSHVVAHGADGSFYSASRGPAVRGFNQDRATGSIRATHLMITGRVERSLRQAIDRGAVTRAEANSTFWHAVNSALHDRGLIDYMASFEPASHVLAATRDAIAAANEGATNVRADRRAIAVRPDEGMARVLAESQELAARKAAGAADQAGNQGGRGGFGEEHESPLGSREEERPAPGVRGQRALPLARDQPPSWPARVLDDINKWLAPAARDGAAPMAHTVRRIAAERAQSGQQTMHALETFGRDMARLPPEEQAAFTDRMEHGQPQPTPELTAVAKGLRTALDGWTKNIQNLGKHIGRPLLENAREDYMGRIWANYDQWSRGEAPGTPDDLKAALQKNYAAAQSKGPIKGSGNFLKQRSFDTLREGMNAGLVPVTTNPVEMQLLKLGEMQKFYHGTLMAEAIKKSDMATFIRGDLRDARDGLVRLKDPTFEAKEHNDDGSTTVHGAWYAPEPLARIFNNYVSRGLAGNSTIYDSIRHAGNALNMAQLGLSGFHATFVTMDTMISQVAHGLEQISRGDIGRGVGNILTGATPLATISAARRGSALRRWYLADPSTLPPEARKMVDALNAGGGRIAMDGFHNANEKGAFVKNLRDVARIASHPGDLARDIGAEFKNNPIMAPFRLAARALQNTTEPLMGFLVPRMKLGVFSQMATDWMRRNPGASREETATAMGKAWDSVDNRLGQMVYDNLFWHKMAKDLAFMSMRSVGWNLGTFREIGGGAKDALTQAARVMRLTKPELTHRMAYTMAMPAVVGMYGALATYLATGAGPQEPLDYFFPPDGQGGRLIIPSYIKDVIEFAHAPAQTALNKTHPLFSMLSQLRQNRDYYGGIIYYPPADNPETGMGGAADTAAGAGMAYGDFLLGQLTPFSIRSAMRQQAQGLSPLQQAMSFWGFQAAPASIANPDKGDAYDARADKRAYRTRQRQYFRSHGAP